MVGMPMASDWWWRASLLCLHLTEQHRGNRGWEELQRWWEMPVPGVVDVNDTSPVLVHLQGGAGLPGHQEGLAMAFLSSSHWPTGLLSLGQKLLFIYFFFLSWKLVKDSAEATLDTGRETTWDTERGRQPPRGGFDELPGRECDVPAREHHLPSSHRTRGWRRSQEPEDPRSRCLAGGTRALLSASPLAQKHRAEGSAPSTVSTHEADIPAGGVCGFNPEAFTATQRRALSHFLTHLLLASP